MVTFTVRNVISIHALREEGDDSRPPPSGLMAHFYPRPPRGGRRARITGFILFENISIHALREEGDVLDSHIYV